MHPATRILNTGIVVATALLLAGCSQFGGGRHLQTLAVANSLNFARPQAPVVISRADLETGPHDMVFAVHVGGSEAAIPFQTDDIDGDGEWDELFFLADLPASGHIPVQIETDRGGHPAPLFKQQVAVRINGNPKPREGYPQGFQEPAWESELFGYRSYGPTQIDYYGKVKPELTLGFYFDPPKHNHHQFWPDKGMDCLFVGQTMGAHAIFVREPDGNIARPWTTNAYHLKGPIPNDAKYDFDIVTEGPLRAILRTRISGWKDSLSASRDYRCEILYEIRAGRRETLVDVRFTQHPQSGRALRLGAGMGALKEDMHVRHTPHFLTAVAKDYEITGKKVGMCARAILTPHNTQTKQIDIPDDPSIKDSRPDNGPNYGLLFEPAVSHVQYAFVGAWDLDGGVQSVAQWEEYLEKITEELRRAPYLR